MIRDTDDETRNTTCASNPHFFTASRFDTETNLYYYRARYYSPKIGRFLQTDPIVDQGGINVYTYCGNNPLVLVDPMGLCTSDEPALGDTRVIFLGEAVTPHNITPMMEEYMEWMQGEGRIWSNVVSALEPSVKVAAHIGYQMALDKATTKAVNNLMSKLAQNAVPWRAWVKLQDQEYQSRRFFWEKWKPVADPDWAEVQGGEDAFYGWNPQGYQEGYRTYAGALDAAQLESLKYDWP